MKDWFGIIVLGAGIMTVYMAVLYLAWRMDPLFGIIALGVELIIIGYVILKIKS